MSNPYASDVDNRGVHIYDACPSCGKRKERKAKLCKRCSDRSRLRELNEKFGRLSYFPREGRYVLIGVPGFKNANTGSHRRGATFAILDGADCYREVKIVDSTFAKLAQTKRLLSDEVRQLNEEDRLYDERGRDA